MTKRLFLLLAISFLILPSCHADNPFVSDGIMTKLGWDTVRYYNHATTKSAAVYADAALTQPIGSVPAQTFVRTIHEYGKPGPWVDYGVDENGKNLTAWHVDYIIYPSGVKGSGWIDGRVISECYVSGKGGLSEHLLLIKCGTSTAFDDLPSVDPQWGDVSNPRNSEYPDAAEASSSTKKSSSSATKKPSASSSSSSASRPTATPTPVRSTVMYQGMAAQIDVLSSYESQITVNGEKLTVLTSELEFESSAKETERLAVIYTPKTGEATLRAKANQNAKMVKKCKGGRYALVLEKKSDFTKIYYNNAVGYIRTSSLKFYPIAQEPYPEGILSLNGYTNGQAEINIRNKAEHGTHICGTYKTGTAVRVIEIGKTWTEVEIDRIRGFIQTRFLTMPQ